MSLLESRHAFPSQADPHATRWLRQHALSEMPAGHVVSQPSGHAARHLHVEQLRIHLVRIRRPTRGWSGPVGLPVAGTVVCVKTSYKILLGFGVLVLLAVPLRVWFGWSATWGTCLGWR